VLQLDQVARLDFRLAGTFSSADGTWRHGAALFRTSVHSQSFRDECRLAEAAKAPGQRHDRRSGSECWFNAAAFKPVPAKFVFVWKFRKKYSRRPGLEEVNLTFSRNFKIRETGNLQFRWEAFNALNRANFGLPVRSIDATTAATITTADSGRLMQPGLRLSF
jgi:hypothetical protein